MAAVRNGADRQTAHEAIRRHSHEAARRLKECGGDADLLERLGKDPLFAGVDLDDVLDPEAYVGRAPAQVDQFIQEIVDPVRARYAESLGTAAELRV